MCRTLRWRFQPEYLEICWLVHIFCPLPLVLWIMPQRFSTHTVWTLIAAGHALLVDCWLALRRPRWPLFWLASNKLTRPHPLPDAGLRSMSVGEDVTHSNRASLHRPRMRHGHRRRCQTSHPCATARAVYASWHSVTTWNIDGNACVHHWLTCYLDQCWL